MSHQPNPDKARPLTELKLTQVSDMVYHQKTPDEICEALQISKPRYFEYVAALRKEWQEHRMLTAEEHFDEMLGRMARLESFIWPKVEQGYMPAVERMLQLYDQVAKLKGLYAPAKSELDVGEQLSKLLARISEDPEPEPLPLPPPRITVVDAEWEDKTEDDPE